MRSGLIRFSRNAIHGPRRFLYAFLWAARPPEDEREVEETSTAAQAPALPVTVLAVLPPPTR